jgi:outer membrane protein, multidrug efflux system
MSATKQIALACATALLAGCSTLTPPAAVLAAAPAQWHAQLPHGGALTDLTRWWQQQGDALLVELIDAAQAVSPTIASAQSRTEQARAARVAAGAALAPTLDASASIARSGPQPGLPMGTISQGGLQASWEIDLFGGNRAGRDAAQARYEGAQAGWHDARVSVAAEVANQYYSARACDKLLAIAVADAASRAQVARLSEPAATAGFQAPATVALARASTAEGNARVSQQRARCELDIKALVALTALPEPQIREKLAGSQPAPQAPFSIASLPAQVLSQRPDLFTAEREVDAASADIGSAQAQRYPRLALSGSVGAAKFRTSGIDTDLSTWAIGPLALSVPLFDGGRLAANVDAAKARYEEAAAAYRANVRQAVREVEQALVILQSAAERSQDVMTAAQGYRVSFNAAESRYKNGVASLLDLEDTRRVLLVAEINVVTLEQEYRAAWIALYRAAGGGWSSPAETNRATP